jgi:hypothetical protein
MLLELFVILARATSLGPGAPRDGLAVLAAAQPPAGPKVERALHELLASSAPARSVGLTLQLLGRMSHRNATLIGAMRGAGSGTSPGRPSRASAGEGSLLEQRRQEGMGTWAE